MTKLLLSGLAFMLALSVNMPGNAVEGAGDRAPSTGGTSPDATPTNRPGTGTTDAGVDTDAEGEDDTPPIGTTESGRARDAGKTPYDKPRKRMPKDDDRH